MLGLSPADWRGSSEDRYETRFVADSEAAEAKYDRGKKKKKRQLSM